MSKGKIGIGIFGFVLGVFSRGLFTALKHKKCERSGDHAYEVRDSNYDNVIRSSE